MNNRAYSTSNRDVAMIITVTAIFVLAIVYNVLSATTIGTNISTDGTLTVSGAATLGNTYSSTTIQATGNILAYASLGIGTSSPGSQLSVKGPFLINSTSTIEGAGLVAQALFSTSSLTFYTNTNNTPRMKIDESGNIGIATMTPTTTFSTTGSGYFTSGLGVGFATSGLGGFYNTGLTVHGSRVGVNGTTSPYQEFGVTGSASLASSATTTISAESTTATSGGCIELRQGVPAGGIARWVRIYVGGFGATNTVAGPVPAVIGAGGAGYLIVEQGRCQ